jgi:hypothetical protein
LPLLWSFRTSSQSVNKRSQSDNPVRPWEGDLDHFEKVLPRAAVSRLIDRTGKLMKTGVLLGAALLALLATAQCFAASDTACESYGKAAAAFAADRIAGTPYQTEVALIRGRSPSPAVADMLIGVADAIYHSPGSNQLVPEGAYGLYRAECLVNHERIAAGGKNINSQAEVDAYLADFRTYNGTGLKALLAKYGIRVTSIETSPLHPDAAHPGDRVGDVALNFNFAGRVSKSAPCDLARWAQGSAPPMAELVRRGAQFPLIAPDQDDPIIYWAATGKCSTAYSY